MAAEKKNNLSLPYSFAHVLDPLRPVNFWMHLQKSGMLNSNGTKKRSENPQKNINPNNLQMPSCKSSLSYLLPSNPRQGSNQCIRGSTGPPGPLGPEGGAGGPVGPKRFTNSGGIRLPAKSGQTFFVLGFLPQKHGQTYNRILQYRYVCH